MYYISTLAQELLALCNYRIASNETKLLSMAQTFRSLWGMVPLPLIIPLQESMTVTFSASSSTETTHQPFPIDAPTINGEIGFSVEICSHIKLKFP